MKKFKRLLFIGALLLIFGITFFTNNKIKKADAVTLPQGTHLDANPDIISVKDLTFEGFANQSVIMKNKIDGTYNKLNSNGSLVLKFKYDVLNDTNTDAIEFRINFDISDVKENINSLWIRGDNVFLNYCTGIGDWHRSGRLAKGIHEIEFGRKAIIDSLGIPTGEYYIYYCCDGEELNNCIATLDSSKMDGIIYFDAYTGENIVYDINYGTLFSYESPQYLSVSDASSQKIITSNICNMYSTSNSPANKSVAFISDIIYHSGSSNFYITANHDDYNWNNSGCIVIMQSGVSFYPTNENGVGGAVKEINYKEKLQSESIHRIEYARLAIMNNGAFSGKYHVYFKLDGKLIYSIDQVIESPVCDGGRLHITGCDRINYVDIYEYEDPLVIGVSDLTQEEFITSKTKGYEYNTILNPENNSVEFAADFDYTVVEGEEPAIYIGHNKEDEYNYSCFISLRQDKVHYGKTDGNGNHLSNGSVSYSSPLVDGSTHKLQYGRKAVMIDSKFTGLYYVYYILDGIEIFSIKQKIADPTSRGGYVFFTGKEGFKYKDIYTLENAKEISINDLKDSAGNNLSNFITIKERSFYSFDNSDHTENYSIVFKFKYQVNYLGSGNQIHFTYTNNGSGPYDSASSFWINHQYFDAFAFHIGNSSLVNSNAGWEDDYLEELLAGEILNVELGRYARLINGVFVGSYVVFVKVNGIVIGRYIEGLPQNVAQGNYLFITADGANTFIDADYTNDFINQETKSSLKVNLKSIGDDDFEIDKMALRFGIRLEKEYFESLVNAGYTFGIKLSYTISDIQNKVYDRYYLDVDFLANEAVLIDGYYQFSAVLSNLSDATIEYNAGVYIKDSNGNRLYNKYAYFSVTSLALYYNNHPEILTDNQKDTIGVLVGLLNGGN